MAVKRVFALVGLLVAVLLAGPAAAQWQDTHKAFRIGFLPTAGAAYDLRKMEPFRAYLEAALGMPVELVPAVSYAALIDAQATDRVQYGIHSATSYVATAATCRCIEPLAVPAAFDGALGFYSVILARADSTIKTVADAKGKVLAVSAGDSVAGRLVPLKALSREGIDPATHFAAVVEASDPAAAISALQGGNVDLAVGWSSLTGDAATGYDFGLLTNLVQSRTLSMDSVKVVWRSPLIPFGPHAVRSDVPDDLKSRLLNAMTAMASTAPQAFDAVDRSPIGGGGFRPIAAPAYAAVADVIGISNVDALGALRSPDTGIGQIPGSAAPAVPAPAEPTPAAPTP